MNNSFGKIMHYGEAAIFCADKKRNGKRVVFTNGCFDIIHAGHVNYLKKAHSMGDLLVVGVNTDASVRRNKGEKRPIVPENERAFVLSSLEQVDIVVLFDEDTPYKLISMIKPDVLVKGGDWPVDKIVGRDIVESGGGKVLSIPFEDETSTSGIIERILKLYG